MHKFFRFAPIALTLFAAGCSMGPSNDVATGPMISQPNPALAQQPAITPAALPATLAPTCPQCGRQNAADAAFCAYCGARLAPEILLDPGEGSDASAQNI